MKILHTHNEEMEKKWNELLNGLSVAEFLDSQFDKETKNFITNSHKQLYIKIAEGEIERLESLKRKHYNEEQPFLKHRNDFNDAYNEIIQDSQNYWNNILQELNK